MADNALNVLLKISADTRSAVRGFADLKRSLIEQETALKAARAEAARLAAQLKAPDADPKIAKEFETARAKAAALKKEVATGQENLERMRRTLAESGINTSRLSESMRTVAREAAAAEGQTQKLASAARQTQRIGQARSVLGIERDTTERDIRAVQAALQRLKDSGTASMQELARATLAAKTRIAELRAENGALAQSLGRIKEQAAIAFAPLAGLGLLAGRGAQDFLQLERKLSEIGTLTRASREEMDAFGRGIRKLAQDMGRDANDLAAAAYNIISAGVDQSRALEVVALSAKAATAGVADVNETARLGLAVMNAYGGTVDNLESIFDVLFSTVNNGVTTIPQLAASLGQALPTAKQAGVSFEELTSAIAQLTQSGIETPRAVTAVNSAIMQLAAPTADAKRRMQELGIAWNGLIGTIEQISKKNLDLAAIRKIIPDAEGAKAVLALSGSFEQLRTKLDDATSSAGAMRTAFEFVDDDKAQDVARFQQAWAELRRALGEVLTLFTPLISAFAGLLRAFNELPASVRAAVVGLTALAVVGRPLRTVLDLLLTGLRTLPGQFRAAGTSASKFALIVRGGFVAIQAAALGWSIGSFLRDEFAVVEKTGVALAAGLLKAWARIEHAWERLKAVFAGRKADEIIAALEKKLEDIDDYATQRFVEIDRKHLKNARAAPGDAARLPPPGAGGNNPFGDDDDGHSSRRRKAAAQLELTRATIEAQAKLIADGIARETALLNQQKEDNLISLRDYYARRSALQVQAANAEIARVVDEIAAQRKILRELERPQPGIKKEDQEQDRLQALAKVRTLTAELTILERKRGDIAGQAARDQAQAEKELVAELDRVQVALLQAQGRTADARTLELAQQYSDLIKRMHVEGDAAGEELVRKLFNVESARAQLNQLRAEYDRTLSQMQVNEQRISNDRDAGLKSEMQARREIIGLHQRTSEELARLVPQMQALGDAVGPDAAGEVARLAEEVRGLGLVVDDVAARVNGSLESGLTQFFDDLAAGTKKGATLFEEFGNAVIGTIRRIAAEKAATQILDMFSGNAVGQFVGKLFGGGAAAAVHHTGGIVGAVAASRTISPLAFVGAPRYHSGGVLGLAPDEVPAILQRGEEVITRNDPRHRNNSGAGNVTVQMTINTPDADSFRRSQGRIARDMADAASRARSRHG